MPAKDSVRIQIFGPAHIFVQINGGGGSAGGSAGLSYLGTCERSPQIEILPEYKPAYADTTGRSIPYDNIAVGTHALIRLDLNKFDLSVYQDIASQVDGMDVGTMVLLEKSDFKVLIKGTSEGYTFNSCTLVGPERIDDLAATDTLLGLVFHAIQPIDGDLYEPEAGAQAPAGTALGSSGGIGGQIGGAFG